MQNIASNIHFILRSYDTPSTNHALGVPVAMHWGFHLDCVSQKVTKSDQILGKQKTRLCKEFVMKFRRPKADPGGLGD